MAITDINISEELMTDAPSIKYRGEEGPKSPQQEQMMMVDSMLRDEYEQYVYDLLEQRPEATPMSFEEFRQMVIGEGMMGGGNPLPEDPTKPVNPFQPKPIGPLPDKREMAAYGGIMGADGRRQYGIGSFFQKMKDKVVDDLIPNEIKDNKALAAAAALVAADQFGIPGTSIGGDKKISSGISELFSNLPDSVKEAPGKVKDFIFDKPIKTVDGKEVEGQSIAQMIGSSLAKNIVPIAGGLTAGLFTKNQPDQQTGMPSDQTAINLQEYTKAANLLDQKQGLAAGMNFLPAVAARKFTPEEMAITYAQAANGGRIGFQEAGPVVDEQTTQMILDMNKRGMDVDTISTMTQQDAATVNAIISSQNQKAEGGIMDLGGMEKDYRAEGGFVPIGREEKADDVPARLSVNEFVFTADAVRNAGGGDIDQGAKVMENMMKHLEAGGQVSEESQGMAGARDMFEVSERLSEVI
jgi:uncharacterized short protein YbdD (DUF466 family)